LSEFILGIETSCDETAAAVVSGEKRILSNVVSSQVDWHRSFRGVVPEIASRKHLEQINAVVAQALADARTGLKDLSGIAVTQGPGLVGALLIGLTTAKALSYARGLALVGVNHLEGHIYASFLDYPELEPPLVALVVSGGHTTLIYMKDHGEYQILGETLDDAAGEAFDKIASFLDLGYPGGPIIDTIAAKGDPEAINFPRAMIKSDNFDFSLSGLKTAVINYVTKTRARGQKINLNDLAASFQAAIVDVLTYKSLRAAQEMKVQKLVVAGGVAANNYLRKKFKELDQRDNLRVYFPSHNLCTDNAAMIAWAGYFHFKRGERLGLEAAPDPNLILTK